MFITSLTINTTVTIVTCWGLQAVDEEPAAFPNFDCLRVMTAARQPVETCSNGNYLVQSSGVGSINPAGPIRAAALLWNAVGRHHHSSKSFKTVPITTDYDISITA